MSMSEGTTPLATSHQGRDGTSQVRAPASTQTWPITLAITLERYVTEPIKHPSYIELSSSCHNGHIQKSSKSHALKRHNGTT